MNENKLSIKQKPQSSKNLKISNQNIVSSFVPSSQVPRVISDQQSCGDMYWRSPVPGFIIATSGSPSDSAWQSENQGRRRGEGEKREG